MDIINILNLLIGNLEKDNLYVGNIVTLDEMQYIGSGDTLYERMIYSKYKPIITKLETSCFYKIKNNTYLDLKIKRLYKSINKNHYYNEKETLEILTDERLYVDEDSLLHAHCYGLVNENSTYISKKKVLKNFDKLKK